MKYTAVFSWPDGKEPRKSARWRNTPHGKTLARKYSKRWRKSEAGRDWTKSHRSGRAARKKFESGGVAAIDPLLAAIMGQRA